MSLNRHAVLVRSSIVFVGGNQYEKVMTTHVDGSNSSETNTHPRPTSGVSAIIDTYPIRSDMRGGFWISSWPALKILFGQPSVYYTHPYSDAHPACWNAAPSPGSAVMASHLVVHKGDQCWDTRKQGPKLLYWFLARFGSI